MPRIKTSTRDNNAQSTYQVPQFLPKILSLLPGQELRLFIPRLKLDSARTVYNRQLNIQGKKHLFTLSLSYPTSELIITRTYTDSEYQWSQSEPQPIQEQAQSHPQLLQPPPIQESPPLTADDVRQLYNAVRHSSRRPSATVAVHTIFTNLTEHRDLSPSHAEELMALAGLDLSLLPLWTPELEQLELEQQKDPWLKLDIKAEEPIQLDTVSHWNEEEKKKFQSLLNEE